MSERAKKVLITYATAGIGHKKAAFAIEEYLKAYQEDIEVRTIDVLDYSNPLFKTAYPNGYLFLINRLIHFWGFLYYFFDIKLIHRMVLGLRKMYHLSNSRRLVKFIQMYRPDVVVATHFLTADVCSYIKKTDSTMITVNVVTDYRGHGFWISDGADLYIVAHDETRNDLVKKWRVDESRVKVAGIPTELKFQMDHSRDFFRSKFGIPGGDFTALLLSGGYGVGPLYELLEGLDKFGQGLSVIVVCGHNKSLYEKIEEFRKKAASRVVNFGFVQNVDELMAASDVYIGKAGGISTAEAIMMGLPLIFVRPIPGQESRNAELMVRHGAGRTVYDLSEIPPIVEKLMKDPSELEKMRSGIKQIRKTGTGREIAAFIAGLCPRKRQRS